MVVASGVKAESPCTDKLVFVYFNGVNTTKNQAKVAVEKHFSKTHGKTTEKGDAILYRLLYNQTNESYYGLEDFVETFDQRLQEQNGLLEDRFELFFGALNGDGTWWSSITDAIPEVIPLLDDFVETVKTGTVEILINSLASPPTLDDYANHQENIERWMKNGSKLLFVSHSQGNLFANAAYDYVEPDIGSDSIKTVHIAPASITLNGEHTLADLDLVINSLRLQGGSVPSITNGIPEYFSRPPGLNGATDVLGHGLLEIYLNQNLSTAARIKGHIEDAFDTLEFSKYKSNTGYALFNGKVYPYTCNPGG